MDYLDNTELECMDTLDRLSDSIYVYFRQRWIVAFFIQACFAISVIIFSKYEVDPQLGTGLAVASLTYDFFLIVYFLKLRAYRKRFVSRVDNIPTDFRFKDELIKQAEVFDAEFCKPHAKNWISNIF